MKAAGSDPVFLTKVKIENCRLSKLTVCAFVSIFWIVVGAYCPVLLSKCSTCRLAGLLTPRPLYGTVMLTGPFSPLLNRPELLLAEML